MAAAAPRNELTAPMILPTFRKTRAREIDAKEIEPVCCDELQCVDAIDATAAVAMEVYDAARGCRNVRAYPWVIVAREQTVGVLFVVVIIVVFQGGFVWIGWDAVHCIRGIACCACT